MTARTRSSRTPAKSSPKTTSPAGSGSTAARILLVEDDPDIAYTIQFNLRREHQFQVDHCAAGLKALDLAHERNYDLVILDLNLPDVDGLAICRELRAQERMRSVPILMLTARVEEHDRVLGLELGADDYISKPFSMRELLARVQAHLRRRGREEGASGDVLEAGELRVDRARFQVLRCGQEVPLRKKEFELLWFLMSHAPRVLSRDIILERVWDYDSTVETRTVDVHVRTLRRKLGGNAIETVVGVGYRFRS